MIHAFIRRIASVEVIAMILCTICLIPSIVSADMGAARKDPEASEDCASESAAVPETVAAEELLYGVLELGGFDSPDLIFGSDDGDFIRTCLGSGIWRLPFHPASVPMRLQS